MVRHLRWVLAGVLAGLLGSAAHLLAVSDEPVGGKGYISLAEFQVAMRMPPVMDRPHLRNITLHHRPHVDVVTAEILDAATLLYRPVTVALPPSQPARHWLTNNAGPAAVASHAVVFHDAWWESAPVMLVCGAMVGLILIGVALPAVVTARSGRSSPVRVANGVTSKPPSTLAHPDPPNPLAEELAELGCQDPGRPDPALVASPAAPLTHEEVSQVSSDLIPTKSYAGEYYPVDRRPGRGFSLLEVLIVIGIVAVLLMLLLAAARTARLEAQTTQCATQLRRLGDALHLYADNNQGLLPAWSGWHTWPPGGSDDSDGAAWTIEMIPYLGNPDSAVYNCPSFPQRFKFRNYFLAAQWSGRSGRNYMKLSDIVLSDRFVLSGDKTQLALYPPPLGRSPHHSDDADPDDNGTDEAILAWPWERGGFYMHRRGNNVLFGDMHVGLMGQYDPQLMTFNPRRMQAWAEVTGN
jgi:prepilin-type N-terminal cleavage/methylation domain-containing protein